MSIDISPETEACLNEEALRQNISVDTLLGGFLNELATKSASGRGVGTAVPVLHLGVIAPLHRRDIYNDGR